MTDIRVRMAPSPTGLFHIGSARTTLFNYLYAKRYGGKFILRIEDTDQARSTREFEQDIIAGIQWLGLDFDEGPGKSGEFGPYYQMQRLDLYQQTAQEMLDKKLAYRCYCTAAELEAEREQQRQNKQPPKYSGKCRHLSAAQIADYEADGRSSVVRFSMPEKVVAFVDLIKGEIKVDIGLSGDLVILKTDGVATYNFANVVDDHLMRISHVIRGEDHISNTPKQIVMYEAMGWEIPQFAHIPLILNQDRSKMSKRSGPTSVTSYREEGFLPEALVNFLSLLGWSPGTDREMFSLADLEQAFDVTKVQSSPAVFNMDKLLWFNGQYLRLLPQADLISRCRPYLEPQLGYWNEAVEGAIVQIMPLIFERLTKLQDVWSLCDFFFADSVAYDLGLIQPGNKTSMECQQAIELLIKELLNIQHWQTPEIETVMRAAVETSGWKIGELFMLTRIAVTGRKNSPPLFETMAVLGQSKVITRLQVALNKFSQPS